MALTSDREKQLKKLIITAENNGETPTFIQDTLIKEFKNKYDEESVEQQYKTPKSFVEAVGKSAGMIFSGLAGAPNASYGWATKTVPEAMKSYRPTQPEEFGKLNTLKELGKGAIKGAGQATMNMGAGLFNLIQPELDWATKGRVQPVSAENIPLFHPSNPTQKMGALAGEGLTNLATMIPASETVSLTGRGVNTASKVVGNRLVKTGERFLDKGLQPGVFKDPVLTKITTDITKYNLESPTRGWRGIAENTEKRIEALKNRIERRVRLDAGLENFDITLSHDNKQINTLNKKVPGVRGAFNEYRDLITVKDAAVIAAEKSIGKKTNLGDLTGLLTLGGAGEIVLHSLLKQSGLGAAAGLVVGGSILGAKKLASKGRGASAMIGTGRGLREMGSKINTENIGHTFSKFNDQFLFNEKGAIDLGGSTPTPQKYQITKVGRVWMEGKDISSGYINKIKINDVSKDFKVGETYDFSANKIFNKNKYGTTVEVHPLSKIETNPERVAIENELNKIKKLNIRVDPSNRILQELNIDKYPEYRAQLDKMNKNIEDTAERKRISEIKDYLEVPFEEKDIVRNAGAKWDPDEGKWYLKGVAGDIPESLKKYSKDTQELKGVLRGRFEIKERINTGLGKINDAAENMGKVNPNLKNVDAETLKEYHSLTPDQLEQRKMDYNKQEAQRRVDYDKKIGARNYLDVPFAEKDIVKAAGAKWDPKSKQWYVDGEVPESIKKYSK